jgi:hypothetical protein
MRPLADLAAELGLDADRARQALAARPAASGPWYVQAIVGLGAWLTGIAIVGLAILFVGITIGESEPLAYSAVGAAAYVVGLVGLRDGRALFASHALIALAGAGAILVAVGVTIHVDDTSAMGLGAGALAAGLLVVPTILLVRDPILQALATAIAAGWVVAWLGEEGVPYAPDILSLASILGTLLTLVPVVGGARPAAIVLLLTLPVSAVLLDLGLAYWPAEGMWPPGLIARIAMAVLLVAMLRELDRRRPRPQGEGWLLAAGAAAAVVAILLPPGGSATVVILVLAYAVGSHALAIIGSLLMAYFLWRFYYDLGASLLEKSLILTAVGVVLLALYAFIDRRRAA